MTPPGANESTRPKRARLPRRDWFLLPLIGLLTICLLAALADLVSWLGFSHSVTELSDCLVSDPKTGVRALPNRVCWDKGSEGKLTEYRFNSCGQRADSECEPKAPGAYRIVMIGSSFAMGDRVANSDSLASLLPAELSRQTGRKVELYNEGMLWGTPHSVSLRFNKILADQPDMILWPIGPWDIQSVKVVMPSGKSNFDKKDASQLSSMSFADRIRFWIGSLARNAVPPPVTVDIAQARLMLQHALYQSQSQYVDSYLLNGSQDAEFLKVEPNAEWKAELKDFDGYVADMEERSTAAGVTFVAVLVPNRAQAAMISMGEWPEGYDPYKFGDDLRAIVSSHGGTYVDILQGFRNPPNPEQYYLPVDGHPDARGHAMVTVLLDKALTGGAVPALRVASETQIGLAKDR